MRRAFVWSALRWAGLLGYGVNGYRALKAWQHCHALTLEVYRVTSGFPGDERYGLTSQLRRAAVSAAANIAEGAARKGRREFAHFLNVTLGSLAELSSLLDIARDLGYAGDPQLAELQQIHTEASKATWGLYRYHRRSS